MASSLGSVGRDALRQNEARRDARVASRRGRMLSPLPVSSRQDHDLSILCEQDSDSLTRVVAGLEELVGEPLTIPQLRLCIQAELGAEAAVSLARQLISLGTLARRRRADPPEVIDALTRGLLAKSWPPAKMERWESIQGQVQRLLSLENIRILVKAIDLSFDYANVYHSARIITDVRPVFDEKEEKSDIVAAIISQVMRLGYRNEDGYQSISLLLDRHDIAELREQCDEALRKADLIERRLARSELTTLDIGEDLDELR